MRDLFDFMQPRARLEDLVRDYGVSAGLIYILPPREASRNATDTSPYASPVASTSRIPAYPSTTSLPPAFASTASLAIPPSKPSSSASSSKITPVSRPTPSQTQTFVKLHPHALPFAMLSITFSTRRVGLVMSSQGRKRTIVETDRDRSEPLERCASRLILSLKAWMNKDAS